MKAIQRQALLCGALSLILAGAVLAQPSSRYDFVKIHDAEIPLSTERVILAPLGLPAISSAGMVAFKGKPHAMYLSDGVDLTLLYDLTQTLEAYMNAPGGLHADGTVVFWTGDDRGERPQYASPGGLLTVISWKSEPAGMPNSFPGINAEYQIVAPSRLTLTDDPECSDYHEIRVGRGKDPWLIMSCHDGLLGLGKSPAPRINDSGTVAFLGRLSDGFAILTKPYLDPNTPTRVADAPGGWVSLSEPALNNGGTIAFAGVKESGESGIYTWSAGAFDTVADNATKPMSPPFSRPAINNHGQAAFVAGGALYAGAKGALTRVIGSGDLIFDRSVTEVFFFEGLNDSGQLAFVVNTNDGRFMVVRADPKGGVTQPGSDVVVQPVDPITNTSPVTLTFENVTGAGATTVTTSGTGAPPPSGLKLGNPPTYYEISTTAGFSGSITVCIDYGSVSYGNENTLKLMHNVGGSWVDITTSLDTAANVICGSTASLSPFAVFEREYAFSGFLAPLAGIPAANTVNAGAALPVKFSLGGDQGLGILKPGYPLARPAECTAGLSGSELTETETASQSGLRYDAAADQYVYVWKTERSWAGSCWQFDIGLNDNSSHSILVHFPAR